MSQWIKCKMAEYISQSDTFVPGPEIVINVDQIVCFNEIWYGGVTNKCENKVFQLTTKIHQLSGVLRVTGPQLDQIFDSATFETSPQKPNYQSRL